MEKKTQRSSNIELLRILAMLMIVGHHFAMHSQFTFPTDAVTLNRTFVHWLDLGGKIGVNVFVLISGYFLVTAKEPRLSKAAKLWGQVLFYSLGLYLVCGLLGICSFDILPIHKAALPLTFRMWWFATTYFVLFLLSPYLNKGLNAMTKGQYRQLLGVMTVLWCLVPTLLREPAEGNDLTWFVYLYCLAGYLRLYGEEIRLKSGMCLAIAVVFMVLNLCWAVLCDILGTLRPGLEELATGFFGMNQLPVLISSVFLLLGFLKMEMGYHPLINKLGSTCFGVYLIHDSIYVRYWMWNLLLPNQSLTQSPYLILWALAEILSIFLICAAIDLIRIATVEKLWMGIVNRAEKSLIR